MHAHAPSHSAPRFEINSIFRTHGPSFRIRHRLSPQQDRVLRDLERCRTPALGGHLYKCAQCAAETVLYNSCLNRHCPTCQGPTHFRWIEQRQKRVLATPYFHLVFTLPAQLRPLAQACPQVLFDLLFAAAAATLLAFGRDPQRLGAQIGFTLVLHTWTRAMLFHPHVHGIVTGGGLSPDGERWLSADPDYLFPVKALSRLFRGKFLYGLTELYTNGALADAGLDPRTFRRLTRSVRTPEWVVYAKPPFGGPAQLLTYLGRYTHRVAIATSRLLSMTDAVITFSTRGAGSCGLPPDEFIRRFLLHVLPAHFVKMRHYGLLAPANVNTRLARAQQLLATATQNAPPPADRAATATLNKSTADGADADPHTATDHWPRCPHCGTGRLLRIASSGRPGYRRPRNAPPPDT